MNNRNTVRRIIAEGIWEDEDGNMHWNIPDLLKVVDLEDTPENRKIATAMIKELMAEHNPTSEIIERATPEE